VVVHFGSSTEKDLGSNPNRNWTDHPTIKKTF